MLDATDHNRHHDAAPARIGGTNPPGPIASAREAMQELSAFAENTPVIEDFEQAKQAAAFIERSVFRKIRLSQRLRLRQRPTQVRLTSQRWPVLHRLLVNSSTRIDNELRRYQESCSRNFE